MSVVLQESIHKLPTKGADRVEHKFKPVDGRTCPSDEALKQFISIYDSVVRKQEKEAALNELREIAEREGKKNAGNDYIRSTKTDQ